MTADTRLTQALLLVTLGLACVLLARRPVRRLSGAGPAFTLWCLPVLLVLAPWLPMPAPDWISLPVLHATTNVAAAAAPGPGPWSAPNVAAGVWLAGVAFGLLRLGTHYARLLRAARPLPARLRRQLADDLPPRDLDRLRQHPAGPAVLWAPRALILLPADFARHFDARERRLVLRHELGHLRRGDPLWSLLAELACALLWFHPLTWLALPRFRLDQELACDERVLREAPQDAAAYARALLHGTGAASHPALIPWLAEPQLKERLTMIQRHRPTTLRRHAGSLVLAMLMVGGLFAAQAATAPQSTPASQNTADNSLTPPRYPAAALHNKQQGLVVLRVLVHADGSVGTITYDAKRSTTQSAELIAAAAGAVRRWHFNPQVKDGRRVDGYARVPIDFSLDEPGAAPAKASSKS
jgi:TonB family protein